jgi:RNA polymerase sigma-70 factor (ECF subfamily)
VTPVSTAGKPFDPSLFRAAWGRIVGLLARQYRLADPSLAEDATQHALLQALRHWPIAGTPDEPLAWLTTVARRHLLDALRASARLGPADELAADNEPCAPLSDARAAGELGDDELALLFACCDPALPLASQVALALKVVCGFSMSEIAAGLLTGEAALAQRMARARKRLTARGKAIAMPAGRALPPRREAALNSIHLLFNEGFAASSGGAGQRPDLCREAIRLARSIAAHPATSHPDADALAALLLLHGARLPSRVDSKGNWLLLAEQNRALWDRQMIAAGLAHLQHSQRADCLSAWHLRACIAAEHAAAPSFAETPWDHILRLYDLLLRLDPAPTTQLARAIALGQVHGPRSGLAALATVLPVLPPSARAYGLAAKAQWLADTDDRSGAIDLLEIAIGCAPQSAAKRLLQQRRANLQDVGA